MYSILDFLADNKNDWTGCINRAIQTVSDAGGGKVVVPKGLYRIGTVELKDNVTLYLEKGSVLKASDHLEDFKYVGYKHNEMGDVRSIVFAINAVNIGIEGEGTIDLNGIIHFDENAPVIPGTVKDRITQKQVKECTWGYKERINQPIFFLGCHNINVSGVTIINASSWTITLADSHYVLIDGVKIFNHPNIPNNDGVHICASSKVTVKGCFMECADDCVAISSIIDWEKPSEDIIVSDCHFKSHSKAIVIGYMQSIVKNVLIQNVIIRDSNRGICIMSSHGDGLVENVRVNNCVVETRVRAGNWWGNGEPIFIMGTYHHSYTKEVQRSWPINVRNIVFSSMVCEGENGIGVIGQDNNIEHITFRDISFKRKPSENLMLKGNVYCVEPSEKVETVPQDNKSYSLVIRNAKHINIENFQHQGIGEEISYIFSE